MAKTPSTETEPPLSALVGEIVRDAEQLIGQHVALLRTEVIQELNKAKRSALALGAGAGLLAVAGVLSTQMLVHLLHEATGLPLWGCYGLVAAGLGAAGYRLLTAGRRQAAGVQLVPPRQTAAALKEDAEWLREQVTAPAT